MQDTPLANDKDRSGLQHLESCTGVWVGETPPLLIVRREGFATSGVMHRSLGGKDSPLQMGRREVVCNIWSHALEFGWVRLLPC